MPLISLDKKKTDAGYLNISNPELTAIDLIEFQHRIESVFRLYIKPRSPATGKGS